MWDEDEFVDYNYSDVATSIDEYGNTTDYLGIPLNFIWTIFDGGTSPDVINKYHYATKLSTDAKQHQKKLIKTMNYIQ